MSLRNDQVMLSPWCVSWHSYMYLDCW